MEKFKLIIKDECIIGQGFISNQRRILGEETCEAIVEPGKGEGNFHASALNKHRLEQSARICEITLSFQTQGKSGSCGRVRMLRKRTVVKPSTCRIGRQVPD